MIYTTKLNDDAVCKITGRSIIFFECFTHTLKKYYWIISQMISLELKNGFDSTFILMPNIKMLTIYSNITGTGDKCHLKKLTKNIVCFTSNCDFEDIVLPKNMIFLKMIYAEIKIMRMNKNMKYVFLEHSSVHTIKPNKNMVQYYCNNCCRYLSAINKKMLYLRMNIIMTNDKQIDLPKKLISLIINNTFNDHNKPFILTPYIRCLNVGSDYDKHIILGYSLNILRIVNWKNFYYMIDNIPNSANKQLIKLVANSHEINNMPNDVSKINLNTNVICAHVYSCCNGNFQNVEPDSKIHVSQIYSHLVQIID